jgi:hypothetical protein
MPAADKYPNIVLVAKDSPSRCVFQNASLLASGSMAALTLTSHSGLAIVPKSKSTTAWANRYFVIDIGIGPSDEALTAQMEESTTIFRGESTTGQYIVVGPQQGINREFAMDVWLEEGKMEVKTQVGITYEIFQDRDLTFTTHSARQFVINGDGTISPRDGLQLVLGTGDIAFGGIAQYCGIQ